MVTLRVGVGPLLLIVSGGRGRLVVDDFEDFRFNQLLKRFMIYIGVSDRTFLIGAEMEYLATG
jgi:hypothetical protein